jgi:hypothetical protein
LRKPECVNRLEGSRKALCLYPEHPLFKRPVRPEHCRECSENVRMVKIAQVAASKASPGTPSERLQEPCGSDVEITPLGTLIYPRTGWEPPPCPPGYRSRSSDQNSDDAWILDPIDAVCEHLELVPADTGACGYRRVARRCKLIESFIGPRTCDTCTRRPDGTG